jgi:hypothetical protein
VQVGVELSMRLEQYEVIVVALQVRAPAQSQPLYTHHVPDEYVLHAAGVPLHVEDDASQTQPVS